MLLTNKQKEFIKNGNHRFNIKIGATRSGKTYLDILYTIASRIRERVGKHGLNVILGVSKSTIERNVLQPMREIYGDELIGTINTSNVAKIMGEDVYCLGAEKVNQVSKIRGASIKYCYCDELAEYNKEVFELLKSRLDKPYSMVDATLNPASELVVQGIDFATLPIGTKFGCNDVVLELTQIGKECHSGCAIFKKMGECIMPKQGVFTRVLHGGVIRPGDELMILD